MSTPVTHPPAQTTVAEQLIGGLSAEFAHLRHLSGPEVAANGGLSLLVAAICAVLMWLAGRLTCYMLRIVPGLSQAQRKSQAREALRLTQLALNIVIVAGGLSVIAEIWGFDPLGWTRTPWGQSVSSAGSKVFVVVVTAAIAFEAASLALQYFHSRLLMQADGDLRRAAQLNTLGPIFRSAVQIVILVLAAMTLLSQIGVQIAPILAGAGVVGIAIGFGAQTLVKDVFTGFFLIIEDIVAVGDVVQIQAFSGTVERMTLRTIRLRAFDGTLHIFPYGEAQIIHNMTKSFSYSAFDIPVKADTDIDQALNVMRETFAGMKRDDACAGLILGDIELAGVDLLSDIGIILKGRIRTQPQARWEVLRAYNRRLKAAFDQAGIVLTHK